MSVTDDARAGAESTSGSMTIPPMGVVLSVVAMLFLGAGAYGLMTPGAAPQLADPAVAWSLIAVGIMLDAAAIFVIFGARSPRRRRGD